MMTDDKLLHNYRELCSHNVVYIQGGPKMAVFLARLNLAYQKTVTFLGPSCIPIPLHFIIVCLYYFS